MYNDNWTECCLFRKVRVPSDKVSSLPPLTLCMLFSSHLRTSTGSLFSSSQDSTKKSAKKDRKKEKKELPKDALARCFASDMPWSPVTADSDTRRE